MTAAQPDRPIPSVSVAASTNHAGTVTVRATNQGMPVEVTIDRSELRYGARALAEQVLRLCRTASLKAGAKRRELLSMRGMDEETLDLLGLPTRAEFDAAVAENDGDFYAPQTWLRRV